MTVSVNRRDGKLTAAEHPLLKILAQHAGKIVTPQTLTAGSLGA
jgi:DNA-binding response OmpR family regulator